MRPRGEGLGYSPASKPRRKREDPYRAIEQNGKVLYGRLQKGAGATVFTECTLSPKGRPLPTKRIWAVAQEETRHVLWWGGGIAGMAEAIFPHPKEWRLGDIDLPLDMITVSDLSRAFARTIASPPSCKSAWEKILGPVDWHAVANRLAVGLATPKDFGSYYMNILHRSFLTNPHNPKATTSRCRCCGIERESIEHFGKCTALKPVFELLRRFDGGPRWDDTRLNLLGIRNKGKAVPSGVSLLHMVAWKSILISTTVSGIKGVPFDTDVVLEHIKKRMRARMQTAQHLALVERNRAQARELPAPRTAALRKWVAGLAQISDEGIITLRPETHEWLYVSGD